MSERERFFDACIVTIAIWCLVFWDVLIMIQIGALILLAMLVAQYSFDKGH